MIFAGMLLSIIRHNMHVYRGTSVFMLAERFSQLVSTPQLCSGWHREFAMPLALGPPSPFHAMMCFTWLGVDNDLHECDLMRLELVDGSCTPYEFHTWATDHLLAFMRRPMAPDDISKLSSLSARLMLECFLCTMVQILAILQFVALTYPPLKQFMSPCTHK